MKTLTDAELLKIIADREFRLANPDPKRDAALMKKLRGNWNRFNELRFNEEDARG